MGSFGVVELLIIFLIIMLLFGGKKIPGIAKSLGDGIRGYKKAMNEEETEEEKKKSLKD